VIKIRSALSVFG